MGDRHIPVECGNGASSEGAVRLGALSQAIESLANEPVARRPARSVVVAVAPETTEVVRFAICEQRR
ncbi:MAG: hypothetical protein KIS66_03600 [Fimbriimonadaceae bacterium]|nr:hypothetical protein [Fimbriimonadaceae bacterium]